MQTAGLSLIPAGSDKKPVGAWKKYQTERTDPARIKQWAADPRTAGFALICGKGSGGAEVIDFDSAELFTRFMTDIPGWATGHVDLAMQQTGGGGTRRASGRHAAG